jgi:hypothetical protein
MFLTMTPQKSRVQPERSPGSLKRENGPVRLDVVPAEASFSQASQVATAEPDFAEEVHERAETVTTLLAGILARPTQVRRWGINE